MAVKSTTKIFIGGTSGVWLFLHYDGDSIPSKSTVAQCLDKQAVTGKLAVESRLCTEADSVTSYRRSLTPILNLVLFYRQALSPITPRVPRRADRYGRNSQLGPGYVQKPTALRHLDRP
ncbi:hypothetical protein Zmor_021735 [Zophobas morio]|uniref:Uncharacterized protein n=1 Tax=Zophobas morio TaxID=2755281 RepID=A0AA38I352_9CUCU|nr:hypothetical protein Zmor_021735 [Zophobas morio]